MELRQNGIQKLLNDSKFCKNAERILQEQSGQTSDTGLWMYIIRGTGEWEPKTVNAYAVPVLKVTPQKYVIRPLTRGKPIYVYQKLPRVNYQPSLREALMKFKRNRNYELDLLYRSIQRSELQLQLFQPRETIHHLDLDQDDELPYK